jgi:hypothetical protein
MASRSEERFGAGERGKKGIEAYFNTKAIYISRD